jgi:hypothetical protein
MKVIDAKGEICWFITKCHLFRGHVQISNSKLKLE